MLLVGYFYVLCRIRYCSIVLHAKKQPAFSPRIPPTPPCALLSHQTHTLHTTPPNIITPSCFSSLLLHHNYGCLPLQHQCHNGVPHWGWQQVDCLVQCRGQDASLFWHCPGYPEPGILLRRLMSIEAQLFRKFFRTSARVVEILWELIVWDSLCPKVGYLKHLLCALNFMKVFPKQGLGVTQHQYFQQSPLPFSWALQIN